MAASVQARGLTKRFGDVTAVAGIDLTVPAGGVHGLLGPNGAGKTTFLRMLFGLVRPDAGTLTADGTVAGVVKSPGFYPYLTAERHLALLADLDGGGSAGRIDALPDQIPLDYGLKTAGPAPSPSPSPSTTASAARPPRRWPRGGGPAALRAVAAQWVTWSEQQAAFTGGAKPRLAQVDPAQLNRIDWYQATGWTRPYPGDARILAPNEVPGKDVPPQELD